MTLKQLIKKKAERLESVPDEFLKEVEKIQKKIFTEILLVIDNIDREGGFITASKSNLIQVAGLIEDLKDAISATDYPQIVDSFAEQFNVQRTLSDQYFEKIDSNFESTKFIDEVFIRAKDDAIGQLIKAPLEANFLKPIDDLIFDAVSTGSSWKDTVQNIRDFVEGSGEKDGRLLQYSKQIAHDTFAYTDRAYSNVVADELEAEWYLYSGSTIKTSRCFCVERHQKYYHYKEIESFGRGENLGDCKDDRGLWAGADRNTDEKTIFVYAGGHLCRHNILMVSVFSVPREVIDRNIANGNFKPDKALIEELGI